MNAQANLLPRWLQAANKARYNHRDIALVLALSLRINGTADAVRQAAKNLQHKVMAEFRTRMQQLAKLDDSRIMRRARDIVQALSDLVGAAPGVFFEVINTRNQPRCHYTLMTLAGEPGARHWACQYCDATQRAEVIV
ncbi:hypothetical protein [Pseudomonas sp.]|uniref:DUF7740 domain-containing protein n=1 Tax=Pseudomonas sp. TaxID=306 RepID=UPI0025879DBB|nr:hypothetical protein [Pseudomonas sp.]